MTKATPHRGTASTEGPHTLARGVSSDGLDLQELLTVEELAAVLKVSTKWVYEHTRSPRVPKAEHLPHLKLGKYLRFELRSVHEFLAKKR